MLVKSFDCVQQYPSDEETVLILLERVNEAQRMAAKEMREMQADDPRSGGKKRKKFDHQEDGDEDEKDIAIIPPGGELEENKSVDKKKQGKFKKQKKH